MSNKRINETLKKFGLSNIDIQVYVFLANQGLNEIREIALALNLPERKVHRSLRDLQDIRIVNASIAYPLKFMAVPFKEVIDLLIEVKKEQAKAMQQAKDELLSSWRKITKKIPEKS